MEYQHEEEMVWSEQVELTNAFDKDTNELLEMIFVINNSAKPALRRLQHRRPIMGSLRSKSTPS